MRPTPDALIILWIVSVVLIGLGLLAGETPSGGALLTGGVVGVVAALSLHTLRSTLRQRDAEVYVDDE